MSRASTNRLTAKIHEQAAEIARLTVFENALDECIESRDVAYKRIEKLEQLTAMIASRSHICSGRDCVGMWIEETGSLLRCNTCEQFRIAIADMEQT